MTHSDNDRRTSALDEAVNPITHFAGRHPNPAEKHPDMKPTKLLLLAALALPMAAFAAPTTLISSSVLNGGFETNGGTASAPGNYYQTAYAMGTGHWFNYGAGTESTTFYSATKYAGAAGGIVSVASQPSIDTTWTIGAHDAYDLSFVYKNSNATTGTLRWHLYYYTTEGDVGFDETSATSRVDLATGDVALATNSTTWYTITGDLADMTDIAAVGKSLYLGFERTATGSFPVIDNVTLTATAVPEPSTYGLLGAGALAAVAFVRRRRKFAGKAV